MVRSGRQEDVSSEREYGLGWVLIAGLETGYSLGSRGVLKVSMLRGYKMIVIAVTDIREPCSICQSLPEISCLLDLTEALGCGCYLSFTD